MSYTQEPDQSLAWLSEAEVFEQVSALALEPCPARLLELTDYELYSIVPDRPPTSLYIIKHELSQAQEKIRALQYQRRPVQTNNSNSESWFGDSSTEGNSEEEACSENDDIKGCIQEQEDIVREKQKELSQAQSKYDQEQAQFRQEERERLREVLEQQQQKRAKEREKIWAEQREARVRLLKARKEEEARPIVQSREEARIFYMKNHAETTRQNLQRFWQLPVARYSQTWEARRQVLGELEIKEEDYI
jgi:hypothetical protein